MGCRVEECDAGITVHGRPLRGIDVDMNAISDTVMTLGAVACFADGPTTIRNVAHIRHKETDRIAALATELRRLGAEVEEFADGLTITPRPLHGATVETYNDHRMAMSLALVGLKVPGVVIKQPRLRREDVSGVLAGFGKTQGLSRSGSCLLRLGPEWTQGVDLGQDFLSCFAASLDELSFELAHLFLAVISAVQLHSTFHHDGQSPSEFGEFGRDTILPAGSRDKQERRRRSCRAICRLVYHVRPWGSFTFRLCLTIPYVDEWEFIPVLFGERPAASWLWELHNEHRFPLPRGVYLGLFQLTGDFRDGCLVSFLGISLCAAGLIWLARRIRGRSSITDAVFPLILMHTGQGENLYMGYQMCFMLVTVLACALLSVMAATGHANRHCRSALVGTLLGWLLLTCGAAGLCYGIAASTWVALLALAGQMKLRQRITLLALSAITPIYIVQYFQGYHRPSHHPESAGIVESGRIALEAQAMALGPAATGIWPAMGIGILLAGLWVGALLWQKVMRRPIDFASIGLLLFIGAGAGVAFGIGWGRSGFYKDMGFAWRYGWITFPPIAAAYFAWLLCGGRVARYGPGGLLVIAMIFAPVNTISGYIDGERKLKPFQDAWEADVAPDGMPTTWSASILQASRGYSRSKKPVFCD